jgi:glutaredoxin
MPPPLLQVYGTLWCSDCLRTRIFLRRHRVAYQWIDIDENAAGEQLVLDTNYGMRSVPTLIFPDGDVLVEPSDQALANKLKITA